MDSLDALLQPSGKKFRKIKLIYVFNSGGKYFLFIYLRRPQGRRSGLGMAPPMGPKRQNYLEVAGSIPGQNIFGKEKNQKSAQLVFAS